jgi:hypothetical protein
MISTMGRRVATVLLPGLLALVLPSAGAQAQCNGTQTQGRSPGQTGLQLTGGSPRNATRTTLHQANALLTAVQQQQTGSPSQNAVFPGMLQQTTVQQQLTALQQQQSALQTALQQTNALLLVVQQSASPDQNTLIALMQQQSALQSALQQTNALLSTLQQNGLQTANPLQATLAAPRRRF